MDVNNGYRQKRAVRSSLFVTTLIIRVNTNTVYGKKSFLSKESYTLRSYRVYISPTM